MSGGTQAIEHEPAGLIDVTGAAVNSFLKTSNTLSRRSLEKEQIEQQYQSIQDLAGDSVESFIGDDFNTDNRWSATDEFIRQKRKEDARYNNVKTTAEMKAATRETARKSQINLENVSKAASPLDRITGQLIGGVGAGFTDPVVLGTAVGGGLLVRAKTALQSVAIEAGIGAGTEIAIQPFVAGWQQEAGNEYGLSDALTSVAFAGLASGAIAGITSGALKSGVIATRDKGSVLFEAAAHYDNTPANLKPILQDMADYISIREQTPFVDKTPQTSALHAKNIDAMDEAFSSGKKATDAEIDMDARLKEGVTVRPSEQRVDTPKPEEEFTANDLRTNENLRLLDDQARERVEAQERQAFEQLIETEPDLTIRLDDGVDVRLADFADQVKRDSALNDAIRVCAI